MIGLLVRAVVAGLILLVEHSVGMRAEQPQFHEIVRREMMLIVPPEHVGITSLPDDREASSFGAIDYLLVERLRNAVRDGFGFFSHTQNTLLDMVTGLDVGHPQGNTHFKGEEA